MGLFENNFKIQGPPGIPPQLISCPTGEGEADIRSRSVPGQAEASQGTMPQIRSWRLFGDLPGAISRLPGALGALSVPKVAPENVPEALGRDPRGLRGRKEVVQESRGSEEK